MKRRDVIFALTSIVLFGAFFVGIAAPKFKQFTQSQSCGNALVAISFAGRVWAGDNNHRLPDNFLVMSNELCTPKFLICPAEKIRQTAKDWGSFTTNNSSYSIVGPNLPDNDMTNPFVACTIHAGYFGYIDGSFFDGHTHRPKW